jgi:hypothetical protein
MTNVERIEQPDPHHERHIEIDMARFVFLLLLMVNLAFAGHIYLTSTKPREAGPAEVNREAMKILSISDAAQAQREAREMKKLVESLASAPCLQFSVKPADAARAQTVLGAMGLGDRLGLKNVEEFTRFAIALPAQKDRKTAETLLTNLKKAKVKDVLIMGDNSVSLGLFSTEDAAKRVVAELESKASALVKGVTITPKNPQIKESVFSIKAPDATLIAKVATIQRDFDASVLNGAACGEVPNTAVVVAAPATGNAEGNAAPPVIEASKVVPVAPTAIKR